MKHFLARMLVITALAMLAACARGPDDAGLVNDVQQRLDALFGHTVLAVQTLKRQGSSSMPAAADGAKRIVVYFNATLKFAEPYDPSNWNQLNPQLIARTLGATDAGLVGLKSGTMAAGDEVRAYGSVVYRRSGTGWAVAETLIAQPKPLEKAPADQERADELIRRFSQLAGSAAARKAGNGEILVEEMDRALQNIALRLDTGEREVAVAAGPEGGAYWSLVYALQSQDEEGAIAVKVAATAGSVENARLVGDGKARFGIVQGDVATAAITGTGDFTGSGPLTQLRAVAALFPEPLHFVVRADADIHSVAGLAGKRLAVGAPGSGARYTVLQALQQLGVAPDSATLVEVRTPTEALAKLAAGEIDAVATVISAPWDPLLDVAQRIPMRLLGLDVESVAKLNANVHGLVPITIPAHTYPGQDDDVRTVAATALLVANSAVPESLVTQMLDVLYDPKTAAGSVAASRLSKKRALLGITVPLHEGAAVYFERKAREAKPAATGPIAATQ